MAKFKVVITARSFGQNDDTPFKILHENGFETVKIPVDRPLSAEELIAHVKYADAIIVGNDSVTKEVIDAAGNLKMISRYGVGYDNVDLAEAKRRGIVVTNTPNTNDNSVADLVFALALAMARQIPAVSATVKSGGWNRLMGYELWNKTMGVVGTGKIGRGVIQRARGFNMRVLCCDVKPDQDITGQFGAIYCSLHDLLKESDVVSIHVPLNKDTKGFIGKIELELMKPTAFLINTARGGIVDEQALYEALAAKTIAGAALDVMEHEPPAGSPFLELENCLITPHIGGYTTDAIKNMGVTAANNVVYVFNNQPGAYIVE